MLNLTQYNGFSARAPSATVTYVGKTEDTSSATTYTFTDHAIGTAANDRYVIVGVFGFEDSASTKTISSMTIGGVSATELVELSAATMGGCWGFYGLSVATGTTATIAVTFSAIQDGSAVMVWRANGLVSTSPTDTATDSTASAALSTTISIQDGGIGIAICGRQSANTTYSWAGLTEDDEGAFNGATESGSGASKAFADGSTVTITCTPAATGTNQGLVIVSMR